MSFVDWSVRVFVGKSVVKGSLAVHQQKHMESSAGRYANAADVDRHGSIHCRVGHDVRAGCKMVFFRWFRHLALQFVLPGLAVSTLGCDQLHVSRPTALFQLTHARCPSELRRHGLRSTTCFGGEPCWPSHVRVVWIVLPHTDRKETCVRSLVPCSPRWKCAHRVLMAATTAQLAASS